MAWRFLWEGMLGKGEGGCRCGGGGVYMTFMFVNVYIVKREWKEMLLYHLPR